MDRKRPRRAAAIAVVAVVLVAALPGAAQGPDDGATAMALVGPLEKDTAHAAVTAMAIGHAKDALERATRLRAVGDEVHARAAAGLAREWAETARDLVRASDAEASASDVRRRAVDAQARLERARALVEDAIARVGRLRAEVDRDGRTTPHDRTAVERHDGAQSPGKKEPPKAAPPKGDAPGDTP
jgi:hypothetical protein